MYEALEQLETDLTALHAHENERPSVKGIGCDLVSIERIKVLYVKYKESFPKRILSAEELKVWTSKIEKNSQSQHLMGYLAKRWAAKEAVVKAMGLGFIKPISWREISILNEANGKPYVSLHGETANFIQAQYEQGYCNNQEGAFNNKVRFLLSLSDEKDHALAFCMII